MLTKEEFDLLLTTITVEQSKAANENKEDMVEKYENIKMKIKQIFRTI